MSEDHGHDHAEIGPEDEHPGLQWDVSLSERAKRSLAMHELLIEKGVVTNEEVETASNNLRRRTPADGAKVVAKASLKTGCKRTPAAATQSNSGAWTRPHDSSGSR